jgi:HD-GYP domain-containing protein (c-di-GMP phosphodiesterase class II)
LVENALQMDISEASLLQRLDKLNEIGAALSKERDLARLLETILLAAKEITNADGGTLYRLTDGEGGARLLTFEIVRNDTLNIALGGTTGNAISFYPIHLVKDGVENNSMVAAHVALTGNTINIADAYSAEGFDFSGTRAFDTKTGYRSTSFLTIPMRDHEGDIIGVLQLLNAKDVVTGKVSAFSKADEQLAESLASQAAIALTNRRLITQLEELFESFITLINGAIDEKSPYTGGHCQRVPTLTMMLAEAVNATTEGPLAGFKMTEKDRYELKIAGLLHDCGKITTPVHVVDKATKLETIFDRIHLVDQRFLLLKRDAEIALLRGHMSEPQYQAKLAQFDDDRAFLRKANVGGEFMAEADVARVQQIAQHQLTDENGQSVAFLSEDEVKNLTIRAGTLTADERQVINHHIVATINMLEALPWPKHLANVPEYAGGHHERMDGKGYPKGLKRDQMSIQARIMGIADIFEALTAPDRPYKKGKTLSESLDILRKFRDNGHIDPDLFDVFIKQKVYAVYGSKFMHESQLDLSV